MRAAIAAAAATAVLAAGCGSPGDTVSVPSPPVLPHSVAPSLPTSDSDLSTSDLAADVAGGSAFAHRLDAWGFLRGHERVFQGESSTIDRIVSRSLVFRDAKGAHAYVRYISAHAAAVYGQGTTTAPLENRGRAGYVVTPAACACHRAAPTLLAVLADGSRVTWLEANGGAVDGRTIDRLVTAAP